MSAALLLLLVVHQVTADCLANDEFNSIFEGLNGASSIPTDGSCCMFDVCGLECPTEVSQPPSGKSASGGRYCGKNET